VCEVGCGDAAMAQSRCSFSILIRYGSLKVRSINAFLTVLLTGRE
jgi:hypothetical protein